MRAAELAETAAHDHAARGGAGAPGAGGGARATPPAVHLLERLYPTLGRWDEHGSGLVDADADASDAPRGAAATTTSRGPAALERLGALHEERLGDPGKALALYSEWALLGPRRPAALRALLRAAEKAGDALVAAEAALKLGTDDPGFTEDAQVRVVLPRGDDLRGARRRRRRGHPRLRGGAGAGARVPARAGRPRARARAAQDASRRWPRCCRGARSSRPTPRTRACSRSRPRASRRRTWAASEAALATLGARAVVRLQRTWARSRSTCACCSAWGAATSWQRRWARWPRS